MFVFNTQSVCLQFASIRSRDVHVVTRVLTAQFDEYCGVFDLRVNKHFTASGYVINISFRLTRKLVFSLVLEIWEMVDVVIDDKLPTINVCVNEPKKAVAWKRHQVISHAIKNTIANTRVPLQEKQFHTLT